MLKKYKFKVKLSLKILNLFIPQNLIKLSWKISQLFLNKEKLLPLLDLLDLESQLLFSFLKDFMTP